MVDAHRNMGGFWGRVGKLDLETGGVGEVEKHCWVWSPLVHCWLCITHFFPLLVFKGVHRVGFYLQVFQSLRLIGRQSVEHVLFDVLVAVGKSMWVFGFQLVIDDEPVLEVEFCFS